MFALFMLHDGFFCRRARGGNIEESIDRDHPQKVDVEAALFFFDVVRSFEVCHGLPACAYLRQLRAVRSSMPHRKQISSVRAFASQVTSSWLRFFRTCRQLTEFRDGKLPENSERFCLFCVVSDCVVDT